MTDIRQTPDHRTDPTGEPTLVVSTTSKFNWRWSDAGSGAHRSVTIWRPRPPEGFYYLGDYAQGNHNGSPDTTAVIVKPVNDDLSNPLVKNPIGYRKVWSDSDSGGDHDGAIWYSVPPDGYVSIGCVVNRGYKKPERLYHLACIRVDWVEETSVGKSIWSDSGSDADDSVTLYPVNGVAAVFAAQGNFEPWAGSAFRVKTL
ncbi:hypothetical protein JOD54_004946 [Actinokineospora baliensis]|uniref:Vps62-related protein n=1 Tax=Actinokineospora baliensis TaxID=547056 RepID=UPI00195A13FA|nr:Vps62-related protein [Actinokineospora baliensis]MBM7774742.1 hypothetical protein [Actinokineospora baliensis]